MQIKTITMTTIPFDTVYDLYHQIAEEINTRVATLCCKEENEYPERTKVAEKLKLKRRYSDGNTFKFGWDKLAFTEADQRLSIEYLIGDEDISAADLFDAMGALYNRRNRVRRIVKKELNRLGYSMSGYKTEFYEIEDSVGYGTHKESGYYLNIVFMLTLINKTGLEQE